MSEGSANRVLTFGDVVSSGKVFGKTSGTYASQRFQALHLWAKNHEKALTIVAVALIITGVALACFCAGGSAFAALALVKLHGLSHLLALNEFYSSCTFWYWFDAMMTASKLTHAVGAMTALFTKIFWCGIAGSATGAGMTVTGIGLKLFARNTEKQV